MKITRLEDAVSYAPAKHDVTIHALYLQHKTLGSEAPYWIGCSYYLPGAKAEWDASPLHKIYLVLDGEITVATEDGEATLRPLDSVSLAPNERREVRNDTNRVATLLVIMPYGPRPGVVKNELIDVETSQTGACSISQNSSAIRRLTKRGHEPPDRA